MAFPTGYTKYQEITIDHTKVSADLTDYVVYVNLADLVKAGADIFDTCRTDGGDIRATKSDGTTQLATELVSIDTTAKTGELYIKFSGTLSSSVDTVIRIYYNGTDTALAVSDTYGRNAVWNGANAVWHLSESSGNATDSTGNGNTGTSTSVTYTAGKVGNGAVYNGSAYHTITDNSTLEPANAITYGGWIYMASASSFQMMMAKGENAGDTRSYEMRMYSTTSQPEIQMRSGASYIQARSATAIGTSTWARVFYARSGTSHAIYINGSAVSLATSTTQAGDIAYSTDNLWLGQRNGGLRFNGRLDDMRLYATQLSASWMSTDYNNQNSSSTFYAVGNEVSSGTTVSASVVSSASSTPTPTVAGGAIVSAGVVSSTSSTPSPTIAGGALISTGSNDLVSSNPAPTILAGGITIAVGVVSSASSTPTPDIIGGTNVAVSVSEVASSVPTPSYLYGVVLEVDSVVAVSSVPTARVDADFWQDTYQANTGDSWNDTY